MTLAPNDMICFTLYSATHAMQQAYKPLLDGLGLTYPQYLVLTALWDRDGQTVSAIGGQLQLASNTLTPLLQRLEAQGLVKRSRSREDERQVLITLTREGKAMKQKARHVPGCILEKSGMGIAELVRLRDEVAALRDQLRKA
ncbi:MAG: MarR family transcriptional regulator [Proteobacteria bacterium]|nr:MarR family transcriptional regulator [Pseudomonadota bacterium]